MDEKELLKELEVYKKKYGEKNKVEDFSSFLIQNGKKSFFKTLDTGHITASGWLVSEDFKKVLLVFHKNLKKLIQPGGHCEGSDGSVKMAALRELKEETGLQDIRLVNDKIFYIDIHEIDSGNKVHSHYDICYLFMCDDKQQITVSGESDAIGWYDLDKIAYMEGMDKGVLKMAERVKEENSDSVGEKTKKFINENGKRLIEAREFVKDQKLKTSTIWEESKKIYRYLSNVKVMIVTANQIECETLLSFFAKDSGYDLVKIGKDDVVYTFFKINECKVVHIEPTNIGAYSQGGTAETIRNAFKVVKPNVILSLGVGFGADLKKNQYGDVMVGRQHFSYDKSTKAVKDGIKIKVLHVEEPDNYMLSRFKSNINTEESMTGTLLNTSFDILLGNMVTGEFVIDSEIFMGMILKPFELFGIIGGEMEAYGIFEEVKNCKYNKISKKIPHCIMAKGICDWGIGKNDLELIPDINVGKNDIQRYAMINACEVCKKFLNNREMFSDLRIRGVRKRILSYLDDKGIKCKKMRVEF